VYGEYGRGGHKETQFKDEGAKGIGKDLRVSAGRLQCAVARSSLRAFCRPTPTPNRSDHVNTTRVTTPLAELKPNNM